MTKNKAAMIVLAAMATIGAIGEAAAQYGPVVRPQWDRTGSAVCPENYDYVRGACRARGGYGGGGYGVGGYGGGGGGGYYQRGYGGGGGGVPPRWNSLGSAVCPSNYDYYAQYNRCLPRY